MSEQAANDPPAEDQPKEEEEKGEGSDADAGEDADDAGKAEYQKRDFVAKPYVSDTIQLVEQEVQTLITKNNRPLI